MIDAIPQQGQPPAHCFARRLLCLRFRLGLGMRLGTRLGTRLRARFWLGALLGAWGRPTGLQHFLGCSLSAQTQAFGLVLELHRSSRRLDAAQPADGVANTFAPHPNDRHRDYGPDEGTYVLEH
ncbi:hypothetical protein GTY68_05915 [Streptomyces sp. SID4926]|nr:hypothetical protein [Streptomyces sp. SID4926]